MRGLTPLLLGVLLLPILLSGLSSPPVQASPSGFEPSPVMIYEVCPAFKAEFVVLENVSPAQANITGWLLTDNEGQVKFNATTILRPGEKVIIASDRNLSASIYPDLRMIEYPAEALVEGRFVLANDGDDLWLKCGNGTIVDGLVYGSVSQSNPLWSGLPLKKVPSGDAARRISISGIGSAADWAIVPPGITSMEPQEFEAVTEPFSCPENALPRLVREIGFASYSIRGCVYELSSPQVVEALLERRKQGVDVDLFLEGQPVSGLSNASIAAAQVLADAGCDVSLLKTFDGYRRYEFLHCKYLIVDECRTTIMSENWGRGLINNRGWGVTIDSRPFSAYMSKLFLEDSRNTSLDVSGIGMLEDRRGDFHANESIGLLGDLLPFPTTVEAIVSPDYAQSELSNLIASAQRRIYLEQLECDPEWIQGPSLITDILQAAERGVEVRLLFDSTWSSDNQGVVSFLNKLATDRSLDLIARCDSKYQDYEIMHNKGLIVDDSCVVSSINWVDSSLNRNREVGVIVRSEEVTSFFCNLFSRDWELDPNPPTIKLESDRIHGKEGEPILLDASGCRDRSGITSYLWDLGGDGTIEWAGERCLVNLPSGNYSVLLTVTDAFNNSATALLEVQVAPRPQERENVEMMLPIFIAGSIFIFATLWKRIKPKK